MEGLNLQNQMSLRTRWIAVGLVLNVSLFLSGCFVTKAELRKEQTQRLALQEANAQENANSADMEEQLRMARGRIEVLENALRQTRNSENDARASADVEKRKLEEKLKVYEETVSRLEKENQTLQAQLHAQQTAQQAAKKSEDASREKLSKMNPYDRADKFFTEKKWREAIVEFQKYRDTYPTGRRYAEATHKIGYSFQELGLKDEAKAFYKEVTEKFPKNPIAEKSKARLKQLK
jgi:TolA-binding protein